MEGEADRKGDGGSPEGQSDGLDEYRAEVKERYPDSAEHDGRKTQRESGQINEVDEGGSGTKKLEAEQNPERANQSVDAEGRPASRAELRPDSGDEHAEITVEHSESSAEPESQNGLEQFRDDIREKYPQGEVSESDAHHESERNSLAKGESTSGSNSHAGGSDYEEKGERTSEEAYSSAADVAPHDGIQDGIKGEDGRAPAAGENDLGTTASQLEESRIEAHDGKAEKWPAEDTRGWEVHDRGAKIDSSQIDSGNAVQVESSGRGVDSNNRDDHVVESSAQLIQEGPGKDDDASVTPVRYEVTETVRTQDAIGDQAMGIRGIAGALQPAEDHNGNSNVEAATNHAENDSGERKLRDEASTERVSLRKESGEPKLLEKPNRDGWEAGEHGLAKNQAQVDATAETAVEKRFSSDPSQTEVASDGKELHDRQAGSREGIENSVSKIPHSRGETKGVGLESQPSEVSEAVNSRPNNRETKAADTTEGLNTLGARAEEKGNRLLTAPSKELPEKHMESNDTSFVVHETKGGPSHYLRIPGEHLDKFGKDEILEARVVRTSAPEKEFYLYSSSSYADPHFNISHLNPTPRESFRVLSMRKVGFPDFVRDFNEHKPRTFGNVTLAHSDGKVTLKVDNLAASVESPKLSARGQGPILEGSVIQGTSRGNIRIAKESEYFSLHFGDYATNHPRIVHMKAKESYIEVGYAQSSSEPDYRTRRIPAVSIEPGKDKSGNEAKNRFTEIDSSNMTKKEIRAWIDTEGNIYSRGMDGKSGPQLAVTQKHREPLDVFARSVGELGVRCKVSRDGHGCHVAKITDTEGVAKIIKEVGPFRTPQKCEQVRQFEEMLKRERKERRRVIERSKALLDL